jgi:hypothetical protein
MRIHLFLALGLALGLALLVSVSAPVGPAGAQGPCDRYLVAVDGSDSTDCSDEAHPCETVQYAIDQAADGDAICVADRALVPGPTVYQETIVITRSLTLDGKWEATCAGIPFECSFSPTACDPERVVLDAQAAGRAIQISGDIAPTIDCFTISGGDAAGQGGDPDGNDAGGGIYSQDAAPIIIHNVISDNYGCATCPSAYGRGGGIYLLNASATAIISGNLIAHNVADESTWGQGGGIMLRGSDAQVLYNTIRDNRAGHSAGDGGGIMIQGGQPTIAHNDILSNTAGLAVLCNGGGIFAWLNASATIEDNLIQGNIALDGTGDPGLISRGGGVFYHGDSGATAIIQGNTIEDNTAGHHHEGEGGGLYLEALDSTSVVADNTVQVNFAAGDGDGDGGGYYIRASDVTLNGGLIQDNYGSVGGEGRGGGLFLNDSTVLVAGAVFSNNIAGGINGFGRGGGAFISDTVASLVGNQFVHNRGALYPDVWPGSGGGIEMYNSPGSLFQDNLFDGNKASVYGGAIFLQASDGVSFTGNTLSGNVANQGGGGYILYSDDVVFQANQIISNTASGGGGLYLYDSAARLDNNIVADNELTSYGGGAGVWIHGNEAQLRHDTLAHNRNGTGVQVTGYWGGNGVASLVNTILVSHTVGISVTAGNTATLEATLWDNGLDWAGAGAINTGTLNYWSNPAFADPPSHDYHITFPSAAVDVGVDAGLTTDIDGDHRPYGPAPDLGADEIIYVSLTPEAGGTLVYTDTQGNPTIIQVPPDAVTDATALVLTPLKTATAPSGFLFAGHAFDLVAYRDDMLVPGLVFEEPVTVVLHYSDADVAGITESFLVLQYWNGSTWEDAACGPYDRHPAENWLAVPICHLSSFAFFGRAGHTTYVPIVLRSDL